MNKSQLLSTAAALLLLGAGAAYAQAPAKDQAPAQPAPAAQQNAPAEKTAPAMKPGEHKAVETNGQAGKADMKGAADSHLNADSKTKGAADIKTNGAAETNKPTDSKSSMDTKTSTDTKSSMDTKSSDTNKAAASTTGQGAAGAAKLSTEQRTKITTVIKQQKVERIEPSKLNISISVGARVPSHVHYYPLPREVVVVYPEWRGYDYILVGDQIIILDPRSHEIVAILDA
jgi:hypothetical protein